MRFARTLSARDGITPAPVPEASACTRVRPRGDPQNTTRPSTLTVFFSGVHLFAFDLGGRALTSQEAGLGLTLPHLVLTLGVDVHFAHPALQALAGVSCGGDRHG